MGMDSITFQVVNFPVKRFAPGATSLQQLDAFIQEHEANKHRLIVKVNPTGIGDAFADRLAMAGFAVVRTRELDDYRGR